VDLSGDYGISATFNVANLRPNVDESEEIPSLRSNSSQLGEDDGDHPIQSLETQTSVQNPAKGSSIVKDVQILLKSWLDHPSSEGGSSPGNWPNFVWLVEVDPGEVISCTHAPLKA